MHVSRMQHGTCTPPHNSTARRWQILVSYVRPRKRIDLSLPSFTTREHAVNIIIYLVTIYSTMAKQYIWCTYFIWVGSVGRYNTPTNPLSGDSWCRKRAVFTVHITSLGIRKAVVLYHEPAKRSGPQTAITRNPY